MDAEAVETTLNQRVGFSSEQFKIEIQNLPRFYGMGQVKKLLIKKLNLKPHKLKPCGPGTKWMFVNFANEEDREAAIAKIDGMKLKGTTLRAFKARAAKDPMIKAAEAVEEVDTRPVRDQIMSAVCPLSDKSYEDQLKLKKAAVEEVLDKLRKEFMKLNGFFSNYGISEESLAHLEDFVPSPVLNGYRNKCEFTVGRQPESNEVTVGFRLSSYRKGSIAVVEIDHLPNVSDLMKEVVAHFQQFVRSSDLEPYDNISQKGYWKQLTVRQSIRNDDLLVWVILHPQELTSDEQSSVKAKIKDHFSSFRGQITSINIQFFGQRQKAMPDPPVECLHGVPHIKETLMNLSFTVSPQAFFQINTEAAEKLYDACGKIASLDDQTVLFDVCCGTGTIGLCLASQVKEVHGVDIVEEAIKDAKANAQANGVKNAYFHAGKKSRLIVNNFV